MTLVHSYTNDICDSSTDTAEYGGLSPFGEEVVARMNDLGIMVDLSHASDDTFHGRGFTEQGTRHCLPLLRQGTVRQSPEPLRRAAFEAEGEWRGDPDVHSECLCEDPAAQSRRRDSARSAVREKHGNYYELDEAGKAAFLADWFAMDEDFPRELATVKDAVDHIDHIVELIGIDHVGIGTDFDGGGAWRTASM